VVGVPIGKTSLEELRDAGATWVVDAVSQVAELVKALTSM